MGVKSQILSKVTNGFNFQMFSTFRNFRELKLCQVKHMSKETMKAESPSETCLLGKVEETEVNGINEESIHKRRIKLLPNQLHLKSK